MQHLPTFEKLRHNQRTNGLDSFNMDSFSSERWSTKLWRSLAKFFWAPATAAFLEAKSSIKTLLRPATGYCQNQYIRDLAIGGLRVLSPSVRLRIYLYIYMFTNHKHGYKYKCIYSRELKLRMRFQFPKFSVEHLEWELLEWRTSNIFII